MRARLMLSLALLAIVSSSPVALANAADDAAASATEAETLLAKADFEGALDAYKTAAKTDTKNMEYRQQYAILRRVIKMRKSIDQESNPEKWEGIFRGLRAFYYEHDIYGEALELDRKACDRLKTPQSAVLLAQSQLKNGKNEDVIETINALPEDAVTTEALVLKGVALARLGRTDEAKGILESLDLPKDAPPYLQYDLACLHALLENTADALAALTACFEGTPPSRLDGVKTSAKTDADLANAVASADFEKVLATQSKVKESSCSGGTSCGSCPSRGSCGSTTKTH
jgi:tetratricopeptide (TPR) repeat protein